ncbi:MAG: sensor histidine kinase [Gemmatimonadaceae bacterium]
MSTSIDAAADPQAVLAAIERRMGFAPAFFEPAAEQGDVLSTLWQQTLSAYLDNPLPALFKERLAAALGRFCSAPYDLVCHACELSALGEPAGAILQFLSTPAPSQQDLVECVARVTALDGHCRFPPANSALERDVFTLAAAVYLGGAPGEIARAALRHALSPSDFAHLITLISYVRMSHDWTAAHPEIAYEADQRYLSHSRTLLGDAPGLADFIATYRDRFAVSWHGGGDGWGGGEGGGEGGRDGRFAQQLLAIVSHNIRNPLGTILNAASVLQRRFAGDERLTKPLELILAATQRAARQIADLLDFSQVRLGGGLPLYYQAEDVHRITRQVADELAPAQSDRTIHVSCKGDGTGTWDGDRVAQVLTHLISNAVTHSPPQSDVFVRSEGENGSVSVSVRNTNKIGSIPEDLRPKLFDPFERGVTRSGDGRRTVGLGLYIMDQIVRAHGGTIDVASDESETTFTVHLPRARD